MMSQCQAILPCLLSSPTSFFGSVDNEVFSTSDESELPSNGLVAAHVAKSMPTPRKMEQKELFGEVPNFRVVIDPDGTPVTIGRLWEEANK